MFTDFRLKAFYVTAQLMSFTKAADKLSISQPAVSKHIRELELTFNVPLFERLGKKIALTPAGEALYIYAEKILSQYKELNYNMNLLNDVHSGELHIGASTTIAQYVLPEILAWFMRRFPEIKTYLLNGNSHDIENALVEHRIDLGLVEGSIRSTAFHYENLMKDELVAITSAKSKYAGMETLSEDEIKKLPFVLREEGSGTLDVFEKALGENGIKMSEMNILIRLGSTESIKRFLLSSDCIAIVSIRAVSSEVLAGVYKIIELPFELYRYFSFVTLHGNDSGVAKMFMDFSKHNID